jgi:hypothetical protein
MENNIYNIIKINLWEGRTWNKILQERITGENPLNEDMGKPTDE